MMYPPCEWEHYRLGVSLIHEPVGVWTSYGLATWSWYCLIPVLAGLWILRRSLRRGHSITRVFGSCLAAQWLWFWGSTLFHGFVHNHFAFGFPHGFAWCTEWPFSIGLGVLTGLIMTLVFVVLKGLARLRSADARRGDEV